MRDEEFIRYIERFCEYIERTNKYIRRKMPGFYRSQKYFEQQRKKASAKMYYAAIEYRRLANAIKKDIERRRGYK